jgi:chitin disaccharide deacetylase
MDVGVHLTLATGAVAGIGVRPILPRAEAPGLHTPDGYLWPTGPEAWKHTNIDEVKRESRAQIEKAIRMGIDPTHLDPHDGIMEDRGGANMADFMKLYAELAKEFNLPIRMPPTRAKLTELGAPGMRAMISRMGVLVPDAGMTSLGKKDFLRKVFHEQAPGTVSEIYIHAAVEGPEVEAVRKRGDWWKVGVGDYQLFTRDRDEIKQAIKDEGLILIGWREIREVQRHGG